MADKQLTGTDGIEYGIVKEFANGSILWFEPITDEKDGFILREENENILAIYVRDSYPEERGVTHD